MTREHYTVLLLHNSWNLKWKKNTKQNERYLLFRPWRTPCKTRAEQLITTPDTWHVFGNLVMYFLANLLWSCWKVKARSIFLFCFLLTYFYAHDFIPVAPIDLITSPIDCSLESWLYSCFPVFLQSCTSEPSFLVIPNWTLGFKAL